MSDTMRSSVFSSRLLIAAAIASTSACSVSAFQPGSDYDVYKTLNLYNCSGNTAFSNLTVPNAADTLPQITPKSGQGWEQWSLFVHGTFPIILRWNRGDPSSSEPSLDKFDVLILDVNGTNVQGSVEGELSYTNDENFKRLAIGDNSLAWDSRAQWFNVSVDINGYQLKLNSFSATHDSFHPNVAFHNGMLDQSSGLFGSVPMTRGHVAESSLATPAKQTISLDGLSALKHVFSEKPLPGYLRQFYGATAWGHSTTFYDTHVFYRTKTTNGTVHDAAYLERSIPTPGVDGLFSSSWAMYAVTDDSKLYNLTIDTNNEINAMLSGCSSTNNIHYAFNLNTSTLLGEFTDLGGGRTSYFSINGTTSAAFEGRAASGAVQGYFEKYEAPSEGDI